MSMATERCGRCGRAMVSMETDPDAIWSLRCPRCAARDARRRDRTKAAMLACTALLAIAGAWQMLIA